MKLKLLPLGILAELNPRFSAAPLAGLGPARRRSLAALMALLLALAFLPPPPARSQSIVSAAPPHPPEATSGKPPALPSRSKSTQRASSAKAERPRPLTQVEEIRRLDVESAGEKIPVHLNGIVTALSGYGGSFFFQDPTDGISVDRAEATVVRVGDRVEISGTTGAGLFAPTVWALKVRVTGHAGPPPARQVDYGDMFGGAQDSRWIELQGVVHSVRASAIFGHDTLLLRLELPGGAVQVILQDFAGLDSGRLVDSTVRVRGVCTTSFNEKRQFVGLGMFVPARSDLEVVQSAPDDPFAVTAVSISNVLQFGQGRRRVKIQGVSTYQIPGQSLYLQDGGGGMRIETDSKEAVGPGRQVEAVGFPVIGEYSPILEDATLRVVGDAAPIAATRIRAKDVITQVLGFNHVPYDQQLVQLQGKVVESRTEGRQRVWILRQDNEVFDAYLPIRSDADPTRNIGPGSILQLTGICAVHAGPDRNPTSFGILLRSTQDIVVLRQAPWWTPSRILWLLAAGAGAMLLVILWVVILRHRVKQQTRIIRESEERFRHLAQHDGLTGLKNRGEVLSALDIEIERCRREQKTLTVALADIDHFKRVNDTHGHLAGDAALRRFAEALSAGLRGYDHAGRYGGEEFLVVLVGVLSEDVERRLADLHAAISNLTVREHDAEFRITCSLGAIFTKPGLEPVDRRVALLAADRNLYEAKQAGRNRIVCRTLEVEVESRG